MRLICPNCDAQYEISAELVPSTGRDVQCSDCGHVWFQGPISFGDEEDAPFIDGTGGFDDEPVAPSFAPPPSPRPSDATDLHSDASSETTAEDQALAPAPEIQPARPAEPPEVPPLAAPTPQDPLLDAQLAADLAEGAELEPSAETPPEALLPRRKLDPAALEVLREEVARETSARAAEAERTAARQAPSPDLGLPEGEPPIRLRLQARDPAAPSLRSDMAAKAEGPAADAKATAREQFPNIEDLNSSLTRTPPARADQMRMSDPLPARRTGFRGGFLLMLGLGLGAWMLYTQAPVLQRKVPEAAPYLRSYVAQVDDARLWFDTKVKGMMGL